ncbi:conserved hypothetical protein [Candidatus Brocadia pituitae]|nr:conserved hypothetical protein [Candidatus Brocadia pituitae]
MKKVIETLRAETESTIRALHALKQFVVLRGSKQHVKKMNENVYFWLLFHSALLTKLFVGLRRLFETDRDTFNFQHALNSFKANINEFMPAALERRKMEGKTKRPVWLKKYMAEIHTPSAADFDSLARLVRPHKKRMTGLYSTAASKVFAHAVHTDKLAIDSALAGTNFEEIEDALNVLWHFYEQVWQMYENGRKPSDVVVPYPYVKEVQEFVERQIMA